MTFVYLMENLKQLNENIVKKHVEYLKQLHSMEKLVLCGPFTDYPGGMVVFFAQDLEEAVQIANSDPFIKDGYKSFQLRTIELANQANNYLL